MRERLGFFVFTGVTLGLWNGLAGVLAWADAYRIEYTEYITLNIVALVIFAVFWKSVDARHRNTTNRVFVGVFAATAVATLLLLLMMLRAGVAFQWALVLASIPQISGAGAVAYGIDRRMWHLPLNYALTGVAGMLWPELVYLWAASSSVIAPLQVAFAWRKPAPDIGAGSR